MFKNVNMSEMKGMFSSSQIPKFSVISTDRGFLLVFTGCVLLTVRNDRHFFKSFDSVLQFIKRHFVDVYSRAVGVEVVVSLDVKCADDV